MMSVIVKDMTMPESCIECKFCIIDSEWDDAVCVCINKLWNDTSKIPKGYRDEGCPLQFYKGG